MLNTRNLTNRLEKDLLEQKLEDVQQKISMKDITMEMSEMRHDYTDLRVLLDEHKVTYSYTCIKII